jgi:hypothetical protein
MVIQREYDLDDPNLDGEQLAWRCCLLGCCERASEIYESHLALWSGDNLASFEHAYFESQALLYSKQSASEPSVKDSDREVLHARVAETLGFLARLLLREYFFSIRYKWRTRSPIGRGNQGRGTANS